MLGIENLALFVGSGILLNLYPGPDTLYIIGRSLSQGRGAGVCAALGIGSGAIVHSLLGAFGLSAILATSAYGFTLLKFAGCFYLVYQGTRMIWEGAHANSANSPALPRAGLMRIYRQGALTNILNPKVALFFLAFLPQFISVSSTHKPLSFIFLGAIFVTTGTLWCLVVALFAASFGNRIRRSSKTSGWLKKANGILFIGLGIKLAVARVEM
jgi:threonine/homoserine/homoserine lactone efflux protein